MNHESRRCLTLLMLALAGVASGCADRATAPSPAVDHLSFSYSGALTGTFDGTGNPQQATDGVIPRGDYATAFSYDASVSTSLAGTFAVLANDAVGTPYGNMLSLTKIPAHTGTFPLSNSVGGLLFFGLTWTPFDFGAPRIFVVNSGEIRVDQYTGTHARGTFSGAATDFDPAPGTPAAVIQIINGQFDVAIDDPLVAPIRCELFAC